MRHPGSEKPERESILRGVYEDNLRIDKNAPARKSARKAASDAAPLPRSAHRGGRRVGALVLVLLLVASAGAAYGLLPGAGSGEAPTRRTSARAEAPGRNVPLPEVVPSGALGSGAGLSLAHVFGLHVKTIVIDPGHGGEEEPGAVGPSGLEEKEVALDVARRLRQRLERRPGYRILMTRAWDEDVSLRERVRFANENRADLFISIHVNWLPDDRVTSIETYYFGQGDEEALRLARRENQRSAYTVAEFNAMMKDIGQTLRLQESKRLATSIQKSLYRNMRVLNQDVDDWGVRTAPFVVLLGVEAPSVLAEISVLSNRAEEEKLKTRAYRERLAAFLEEGIVSYLSGRTHPQASTEPILGYGKEE